MVARVFLLPWSSASAPALFSVLSAPALYDLNPLPPPKSVEDFIRRHDPEYRKDTLAYSVHLDSESGKPMGLAVVQVENSSACEIGFLVSPDHWGRGLGKELLDLLIVELARKGCPLVVSARVDERNIRSVRLLEKCGFVYVKKVETMLKREATVDLIFQRNIGDSELANHEARTSESL